MKFKSEEPSVPTSDAEGEMVFYDVEVFPNLFLVNWKFAGEGKPVVRMINPKPSDIEELLRLKLVGFNNRGYDNHMLYACLMGYNNEQLYNLSQKLVSKDKAIQRKAKFGEAYNLSYTDVHDFSNTKQSLKKWEIALGIHHQELGLPWDQPVPEELWPRVAEYCDNDVIATEAVFNHLKADWTARQILADLAGLTVNDTTNTLTARIIFGSNRKPQDQFNYRNMGDILEVNAKEISVNGELDLKNFNDNYTLFNKQNKPIFPGYKYEFGKSTYRGEEVGEGGYVYAEPGIYTDVALLDVASMHPASIIAEELFGVEYTKRFKELRDARLAIKHEDYDTVRKMLDGKLAKYLTDEYSPADLAYAIKIPINMVYGQTAASFENPFRDNRNKDNIVAKRGALFMVNLKHEVQKRGFTVAHIKTDSIKVPNATPEIIQFITEYGKMYGYEFEHEATYERMCLVNDAVYIAKYKDGKHAGEWTATGKQFQIPYVYKTLFSKEPIEFDDMCETIAVTQGALYLDVNENLGEDEHEYRFVGRVGSFCPIETGHNGGILWRVNDDKYFAPPGTLKDPKKKIPYRWYEAESVKILNKEEAIDRSYYDDLVNKAVEAISKYGDFEWFVSDDPLPDTTLFTPPWLMACGKETCEGCPHFDYDETHMSCKLGHDISDLAALNNK
jgi:hypothetical protein